MTDVLIVAVIAAIPASLSAIVGILNSMKLMNIHISINSRMDELLTAKASEAKEVGRAEGVSAERERK